MGQQPWLDNSLAELRDEPPAGDFEIGRERWSEAEYLKREAFTHPKTLDLAARLSLPHAYAFAHVAYLFNAAADIAAQGNIGKWPNGVIARKSEWTGDPDTFVTAMISAAWLDSHAHPDVRLLIHDWPDHAERFVKAKLSRERVWFHWAYYASGERAWDGPDGLRLVVPDDYRTPSQAVVLTTEPITDASPPWDPTKPIPTQPNPTQPNHRASVPYPAGFEAWFSHYPRHVGKREAAAAHGRAIDRISAAHDVSKTDANLWLIAVTTRFSESPAGRAGSFTPHPATWLNQGRYDDDPAEWQRPNANCPRLKQGPGQTYDEHAKAKDPNHGKL